MADSDTSAEADSSRGRTSSGEQPPSGLGRRLSELARSLESEPDLDDMLQAIVEAAVINIPGADHAGVTMVTNRGQQVETAAATDDLVRRVDHAQYQSGEGPCLSTALHHVTVVSNDLTREERWPLFAARAVLLGVHSMLAVQLFVDEHDLGALNLYSREFNAFDAADEESGLLLASHAAVALASAQRSRNLNVAVVNRDIIGQAKGILMERFKINANQAFLQIARASQATNRKLHEIAELVAETGQSPAELTATLGRKAP